MVYTRKILAKIGRHLIESDPVIAKNILEEIKTGPDKDIKKIPMYFISFCREINVNPEQQKGLVFDRQRCENNKIFISAMVEIYNNQRLVGKTISETLNKKQPLVSRQVSEVKFRYKKDEDFKNKVDNILKLFL